MYMNVKNKKPKLLAITVWACIALPLLACGAQAADVFGKITSLDDNSNIQGVKIKLIGALTDSTTSYINGDYSISVPDGIYQVLVGKQGFRTFKADSDTLSGSVRRNAAMVDTIVTAENFLRLWGRYSFQGTKINPFVFDVADPLSPQIKLELSGYTAQDSTQIALNKDYFNNAFEREYLKFAPVNDDGITMHKSASNYSTLATNSQGIILSSDVYADTTLLHDIHEDGHAIGLYHDNSREGFMNSAATYPINTLDKKIVNTGYDYMDAFKDGRTDFYFAMLSDTSIVSGVEGNSPEQAKFPIKAMNLSNYPNPTREYTNIRFNLSRNEKANLCLYNISGQRIYQYSFSGMAGPNSRAINVKSLPSGVYMISVEAGQQRTFEKITIVN